MTTKRYTMNDTFCFASPASTMNGGMCNMKQTFASKQQPTAFENGKMDKTKLLDLIRNQGLTTANPQMFMGVLTSSPIIVQTAIPPPSLPQPPSQNTKLDLNFEKKGDFPKPDSLMMANKPLYNYLENIQNDVAEEELNAPIYFSEKPINTDNKSKIENGLSKLSLGFNSIKNLWSSVIKLPTVIMASLSETPYSTPLHTSQDNGNRFYFDVDDVDFMPEMDFKDVEESLYCSTIADTPTDLGKFADSEERKEECKLEKEAESVLPNVINNSPLIQVPELMIEEKEGDMSIENDKESESADHKTIKTETSRNNKRMESPRKRTTMLIPRSPPLEVKNAKRQMTSSPFKPSPHFFHEKRSMSKNKKEKKRHEIYANMLEDYTVSTDTDEETDPEVWFSPKEEVNLLPVTARNLIEPSCLGHLSNLQVPVSNRRRSSSFHSYEKDFPLMFSSKLKQKELSPNFEENVIVRKRNSICFMVLLPDMPKRPKCEPPNLCRKELILSSSASSSATPSSSCENGKFWDRKTTLQRQKERTVSEEFSDDDIVFIREEGDEDNQDVSRSFWDYASDSDSSSDEEEEDYEYFPAPGDVPTIEDISAPEENPAIEEEPQPENAVNDNLKKVRFNLKPQVKMMRTWNFAHKQARKGKWEEVGRDRVRFGDRIRRTEMELKGILQPDHRERIFQKRFIMDPNQLVTGVAS